MTDFLSLSPHYGLQNVATTLVDKIPPALPDLTSVLKGAEHRTGSSGGEQEGDNTHWRVDQTGVAPGSRHAGRSVPSRWGTVANEVRLNFR